MNSWTIQIEWHSASTPGDLEAIAEQLSGYHATPAATAEPGRSAMRLTVEKPTLRGAADTALKAVREAVETAGSDFIPVGLEILDAETSQRRRRNPPLPALVTGPDIAAMAGITTQRVHQLVRRPDFPPIVLEIGREKLRLRSQVEDFLNSWDRSVGRPKAGGQ